MKLLFGVVQTQNRDELFGHGAHVRPSNVAILLRFGSSCLIGMQLGRSIDLLLILSCDIAFIELH